QGLNGAPDTPVTTTFSTAPINVSSIPEFALSDLTVRIALENQGRDLRDFQLDLIGPTGVSIRLLNAGIDGNGNSVNPSPLVFFPTGLVPQDKFMGSVVAAGDGLATIGSTWFSDQGARKINDPQNTSPYIGMYRPESSKTFLDVFGPSKLATSSLDGV